jgi:hypothetical protein
MNSSSVHPSEIKLPDCGQLLCALQQEIQTSVHAISANALSDFELSLWRQEMLCGRLKRNLAAISASARDQPFRNGLRESLTELKTAADSYQKVVLRCSRSASVLQDLCRLYRGAAPASRANMLSLSCEV